MAATMLSDHEKRITEHEQRIKKLEEKNDEKEKITPRER